MPDENIHANHRSRMRKRYIEKGIEAFAEHEILEMLLYYCYPRRDTNEIAHNMINKFGSLHNLMDADVKVIQERCGVNENIAVLVNRIPSLARRYTLSKWDSKKQLNNAKTAGDFAVSLFMDATVENFYVICLDKQYHVNKVEHLAEGTLDETAVYPREVVSAAIRHQATAVILAHNHPGGSIKPSRMDLEITRRLREGLEFIHVDVLDHIIVAGGKYYSMANRGQFVMGY